MNLLIQKLKNKSGDTILEVLVALLIVVLCLTFLFESIATSNGMISTIKGQNVLPAEYKKIEYDEEFPSPSPTDTSATGG